MTRKSNPGHYIHLKRIADTQNDMAKYVGMKGLRGFAKKLSWAIVEPTRGVWNFRELVDDCRWCADHGMQLIYILEDKTFVGDNPMPEYLHAISFDNRLPRGYTAGRWLPRYVRRIKALLTAMGDYMDQMPAFEGVMGVETSLSLDRYILDTNDYDPIAYRDSYIEIIDHMRGAFPTSNYFFNQNFFARGQQFIGEILEHVVTNGYDHVVQGGPDLLQESDALLQRAYPLYPPAAQHMKNFIMMSWDSFAEWYELEKRNHTMQEQMDFALNPLQCQYVLWYPRLEFWRQVTAIIEKPFP